MCSGETETYFQELVHATVDTGKSKHVRVDQQVEDPEGR